MAKLEQKMVDARCRAAQRRWDQMPTDVAKTEFAYELQGWCASMDERGIPVEISIGKIAELLAMLAKANGVKI
jgi:hypothetical protein